VGAKTTWKWPIIFKRPLRKKRNVIDNNNIINTFYIMCKKISSNISYRYVMVIRCLYNVVGGMNSDLAQSWWGFCNNYVKATHIGDTLCENLSYTIRVPCYYQNFKWNQSTYLLIYLIVRWIFSILIIFPQQIVVFNVLNYTLTWVLGYGYLFRK
jgi:hypothetical protein